MNARCRVTALLVALLVGLSMPLSAAAVAPLADDDAITVGEDASPVTIDVLANDDQLGPDPLSIESSTNPAHGTVVIAGDDQTLTYEPDPDYNGPDTFDYVVTDGTDSDTASVDVTVTSVNDEPVADVDSFTIDEDATTDLDVLAGDTDVDGDTLTIAGNPPDGAHGTTIVSAGKVRYNPDADYHGSDTFTYTVSDGHGGTDTASVTVTIEPTSDGPTANNDTESVTEDVTTTLDIVDNDTDPDDDTLTVSAIGTAPDKGTVTITNGGADVSYDPNLNSTGSDDFTYTVIDGNGGTDSATVNITIVAVNDPPNAVDDDATVNEDSPEIIDVLANDTDPDSSRTVTAVTQGSKGSVSISNGGDDVTYVPDGNATGSDAFTYTLTAGGETDTATVHVTIGGNNDQPTATADSATFDEDATTDIDVLANDEDIDGDGLTVTDSTDGSHGSTSIVGGKVRYTPTPDEHGADTFTYTVSDGEGGADTATVSITITSVNDAPVADDDDVGVAEDAAATSLPVLAGDIDVDGDVLQIVGKTNGAKGMVAITGGGTGLTYDPFTNQTGSDTFTYTISDGVETDTATVTVEIGGDNDAPNAVNDPSMSVPQGASATVVDVLANDSDPDGDALTITAVTSAAHGSVLITGSGTGLTYNPASLYKGPDSFKYTLSDGHGGTDTAIVLISVVRDTADPVVAAPAQRLLGQTVGTSTTKVRLTWGATDAGVGVASYRLQVSTNGGGYATIKLPKATSTSIDRSLTTGRTYRFRVSATDKEGNVSTYRYGPTFTVSRYSQEHPAVAYVASWRKSVTSKALNGSTRNATTPTRSATLTFTAHDIGWVTTRATTSGRAEIYLDGVLVKTIDLDTSSTAYRKLVFQAHFATLATHTIQIRPVGDGRVDIDGFVVLR